jgi:hypothetical protein
LDFGVLRFMTRKLATIPLVLAVAACDQPPPAETAATEAPASLPPAPQISGGDIPAMTPPVLAPEAEKGEMGARNILLSFARALELGEFGHAYAMLGEGARGSVSREAFAAGFADMGRLTVAIPEGEMTGGAGSLYYEAPIQVSGERGDPLAGTAVVRRANDVPGASPEQLRWHFDRVNLAPAR